MVAGVAYSSFRFRPLGHPPLVRNASFGIQNTIPRESMKTINSCFSRSQGKNHWIHIAARMAKHMRGAYEINDFMKLCSLVFGGFFLSKFCCTAGCAPNCAQKGIPRECNEFEYKRESGNHTETNVAQWHKCIQNPTLKVTFWHNQLKMWLWFAFAVSKFQC